MLGKLWAGASRLFQFSAGYEAVEPNLRRKSIAPNHQSEDLILDAPRRSRMLANARDIHRNYALAGWAIRRHLDYVASFEFQCRTKDRGFNREVEAFIETWGRAYNWDAARRHNRERFLRLLEVRAVLDGDCGVAKLRDGRQQAIESDRIRNPGGGTVNGQWVHGVKLDKAGGALAYAVSRRTSLSGFEHDREYPAGVFHLHGYHDRFDQVRGVSPLAAALNPLRDTHEAGVYALAKMKVEQLFTMKITSDTSDSAAPIDASNPEETNPRKRKYSVDFGNGPVLLQLDKGDDADFLASSNPSTQFQSFMRFTIDMALKSLDIPYSFYDEAHTNFFGQRGAWLHYERSCKHKREALIDYLTRMTLWRLTLAIIDGELILPSGWTLSDVLFEWFATGVPWWDASKEIAAELVACSAGFDNPQRIVKERGRGDFYDNIDALAKAHAYARERGVPLSLTPPSTAAPEPVDPRNENPQAEKP